MRYGKEIIKQTKTIAHVSCCQTVASIYCEPQSIQPNKRDVNGTFCSSFFCCCSLLSSIVCLFTRADSLSAEVFFVLYSCFVALVFFYQLNFLRSHMCNASALDMIYIRTQALSIIIQYSVFAHIQHRKYGKLHLNSATASNKV